MSVPWSPHIGLLLTVPHLRTGVKFELESLKHGWWSLLVVTTANEIESWLVTDLEALVVVREGYFEVVDAVIDLVFGDLRSLAIE